SAPATIPSHHRTPTSPPPPCRLPFLPSTPPLPPRPTLFPYTTLFRSSRRFARRAASGSRRPRPRRLPPIRCSRRRHGFAWGSPRSEEHTSELQSRSDLVCRLLLEKKKNQPRQCSPNRRTAPNSAPSST